MLENENNSPKAAANPSEKGLVSKLERFLGGALARIRSAWQNKSASTGIQFYIETDD